MGRTFYFAWEVDLLVWIQTFVNGFTTLIAMLLQICGEESFLIFVLGLLYWCIDKNWVGEFLLPWPEAWFSELLSRASH